MKDDKFIKYMDWLIIWLMVLGALLLTGVTLLLLIEIIKCILN